MLSIKTTPQGCRHPTPHKSDNDAYESERNEQGPNCYEFAKATNGKSRNG